MKNKLRIFLILAISLTTFFIANIVGYSIWDLNQPPQEESIDGDISSDDFVELKGITITNSKDLKMGVFFYEDNNQNTATGDLQFTITFDRANLPDDIKNDSFSLLSYLSLSEKLYDNNDEEITVLSGTTLDTIKLNDVELENIDDVQIINGTIIAAVPVTSTDTVITIDYIFTQNLVLNFGDKLKGKTFNLTLSYIKDGN